MGIPVIKNSQLYEAIEKEYRDATDIRVRTTRFQDILENALENESQEVSNAIDFTIFRFIDRVDWDKEKKTIAIYGSGFNFLDPNTSEEGFIIQG